MPNNPKDTSINEILEDLAYQAYLTAHAPGYTKLHFRRNKAEITKATTALYTLIASSLPGKYHQVDEDESSYASGYNTALRQAEQELKELFNE